MKQKRAFIAITDILNGVTKFNFFVNNKWIYYLFSVSQNTHKM